MGIKTIAVLTSGGDAPGMNSAVRSVVRSAIDRDMRVMGIYRGYNGLIHGDVSQLNLRSVSDIINRGGTVLYTARSSEFKTDEGIKKAVETCKLTGIEGVIVIGGDGSFRGAKKLSDAGIPCIGIPGTIDNDIACTEYSIGFDTAMNTAMEMVDKLRDTAQSHDRCSIVEVMGRNCGDLALHIGTAVGAMAILVPEVPFDVDEDVVKKMKFSQMMGKKHFIIVMAEGVHGVEDIAAQLKLKTGFDCRKTILGHVQRGGSPTLRDRVVASQMGFLAVELLEQGLGNRVISIKNDKMVHYDITDALSMTKDFDMDLYRMAMRISI